MADDTVENENLYSQNGSVKVAVAVASSVRGKRVQNRVEVVDLMSLYAAPSSSPPTTGNDVASLPPNAGDLPVPPQPAKTKATKAKATSSAVARPPRAPSTAKLEKDFEKLPAAQRAALLTKWSNPALLPTVRSEDAAVETSGGQSGVGGASLCKVARTDEAELCSLRLQLGGILKQIADLQGKEKRVKLSIKKLQKKVAAKNSIGLVSLEAVDSVLDKLFYKPLAKAGIVRSRSAPVPSSSTTLWSLAQQCRESLALVATSKLLDESRYESLEVATAASMEELETCDHEAPRQDQTSTAHHVENTCLAAAAPTTPMPALLSQLFRELGGKDTEACLQAPDTSPCEEDLTDAELCLIRSIALSSDNRDVLTAALLAKMVAQQPWDVHHLDVSTWLCKAWLASVEGSYGAPSSLAAAPIDVAEDAIVEDIDDLDEEAQSVQATEAARRTPPPPAPPASFPASPSLSPKADSSEREAELQSTSGKRSCPLAASPSYFTQSSSKKPRSNNSNSSSSGDGVVDEDRDAGPTQVEEICLITPTPPFSCADPFPREVVDLCSVYDLEDLPLESELLEPIAAATALPSFLHCSSSSLPQTPTAMARKSSLLQEMRVVDARYSQTQGARTTTHTEVLSQSSVGIFTQTELAVRDADLSIRTRFSQDPPASTRQMGTQVTEPKSKTIRRQHTTAGSQPLPPPPPPPPPSLTFATAGEDALAMDAADQALPLSALREFLMQNKAMYEKILLFVPIEVDEVQGYLRACGHRVSKAVLLNMLDSLTIFVGANGKKAKRGSSE